MLTLQGASTKTMISFKMRKVSFALKKWKALPNSYSRYWGYYQKTRIFLNRLDSFVNRTLSRSYGAFKNKFYNGEAAKRRTVLQLIQNHPNKQTKFFHKWYQFSLALKHVEKNQQI